MISSLSLAYSPLDQEQEQQEQSQVVKEQVFPEFLSNMSISQRGLGANVRNSNRSTVHETVHASAPETVHVAAPETVHATVHAPSPVLSCDASDVQNTLDAYEQVPKVTDDVDDGARGGLEWAKEYMVFHVPAGQPYTKLISLVLRAHKEGMAQLGQQAYNAMVARMKSRDEYGAVYEVLSSALRNPPPVLEVEGFPSTSQRVLPPKLAKLLAKIESKALRKHKYVASFFNAPSLLSDIVKRAAAHGNGGSATVLPSIDPPLEVPADVLKWLGNNRCTLARELLLAPSERVRVRFDVLSMGKQALNSVDPALYSMRVGLVGSLFQMVAMWNAKYSSEMLIMRLLFQQQSSSSYAPVDKLYTDMQKERDDDVRATAAVYAPDNTRQYAPVEKLFTMMQQERDTESVATSSATSSSEEKEDKKKADTVCAASAGAESAASAASAVKADKAVKAVKADIADIAIPSFTQRLYNALSIGVQNDPIRNMLRLQVRVSKTLGVYVTAGVAGVARENAADAADAADAEDVRLHSGMLHGDAHLSPSDKNHWLAVNMWMLRHKDNTVVSNFAHGLLDRCFAGHMVDGVFNTTQ